MDSYDLVDNFKIWWTIRKFGGQFENLVDNSKIWWTIRKFGGQFENLVDNFVHETTTPSMGGQLKLLNVRGQLLSMENCPRMLQDPNFKF
jgi:hypothetical protein